ncbi:BT4734/BF3469 family protein [Pedobacter ginsengisoli]|uniref:BT4734/BF3469 family protein n=1 Tax=Pedobacter ginsengisoli TaxID=363852 RepID=UPI00254C7FE6|nr:BT4734/BF3469 family protein [Pedobacter ginsengisoli]
MQKFSFYKGGIRVTKPHSEITIKEAVTAITGIKYKEAIEKLREATDPAVKDMRKRGLDYFTFSGTFKKRHNDELVKHSGLICVDLDPYRKSKAKEPELVNPRLIDEFEQVRKDLEADPYTLCLFTSASGTGYKVVFKASQEEHLEAFHGIESLYKEKYSLVLDKGVNDVSRACFVSYDPDAYYNEKARTFKITNNPVKKDEPVVEAKEADNSPATENDPGETSEAGEVKPLKPSEQFQHNKNLLRATYVVDQAERDQVDLTGAYDDWQLIAFSLATFKEDGRSLFHRVSKIYSEYDQKKTDEKFDNAVATTKFTTPNKFFTLAREYGLQIYLPKTIAEKKDEVTYRDLLDNEEQVDDMSVYGFYYNENTRTYWSLSDKGKKLEITNFKMRIIYHVETSDEEAYRLIQIKNIFGLDVTIQMNTDDFVSAASFKKRIARKGNFLFKGTDTDLCRLQDKLQRDERKTELVKQLGYNRRYNFYAWANGLYDCHLKVFVPADSMGIVEHYQLNGDEMEPLNFFIPALSSMFINKEDTYVNDKRFLYVDRDIQFKDWSSLYCKVYGDIGKISLCFYVMALFSDIIFRVMGDRFPMLNVYGQKGTGKGTMIESMMKLFGLGQKQLMLGGASTVVGFMRKSGQFSNGLVWLDEYKNSVKTNVIESIKNLFDRIGYERGKKDNTFQTESTRVDSAVIVSGQEMPIIEEALFSRFILLITTKPVKTEAARKNFETLKELEGDGLSAITVYLLRHRDYIAKNFKKAFSDEQSLLYTAVNNHEVDDRFINNYAAVCAIGTILKDLETLPFNISELRELCRKTLMEQFFVLRGSDSIGKFWNIVELLFRDGQVIEDRDFIIKDSKLYIRIQDIYQGYAEAMQKRRDPSGLDEATLRNYLENDPRSFINREKKFFGGSQRWCFVFKYTELGINLVRAANSEELRIKYAAMGLKYEDDEPVKAKQPEAVQSTMSLETKPEIKKEPAGISTEGNDEETPF